MRYLILFFTILITTSCKKEFITPEVKILYESVMAVHDEVMPEISTMNKLKRRIKKVDPSSSQSLDLLKRLEDADEGMMSWMAEFKLNKKANASDQVIYLKEEQLRIEKVSKDMRSIIIDVKAYLEKLDK